MYFDVVLRRTQRNRKKQMAKLAKNQVVARAKKIVEKQKVCAKAYMFSLGA
jgi:hypothetical protein